MRLKWFLFIFTAVVGLMSNACSDGTGASDFDRLAQPIIDGSQSPDGLTPALNEYEQNAAGGLLYRSWGGDVQGCSGTLVGDRVVLTAQHCILYNLQEYLDGAEPDYVNPGDVSFFTGDNAESPICQIQVSEIHPAPGFDFDEKQDIPVHDLAILILESSALDQCDETLPIAANMSDIGQDLLDELVLTGGFGSLDGTDNFSPTRYWAQLEINTIRDTVITARNLESGFPTRGDSGGGLFIELPEKGVRNIGVVSKGTMPTMHYPRTDADRDWFMEFTDESLLCGSIPAAGTCIEHFAVHCTEEGLSNENCAAQQLECVIDGEGQASCGQSDTSDPDADIDAGADAGTDADIDSPASESSSSQGCSATSQRVFGASPLVILFL